MQGEQKYLLLKSDLLCEPEKFLEAQFHPEREIKVAEQSVFSRHPYKSLIPEIHKCFTFLTCQKGNRLYLGFANSEYLETQTSLPADGT